jgi:16S rRNA processing protein RimM
MAGTEVVVGRIGRPHGLRGELGVEVRTDEPERRFARGALLRVGEPPSGGPDLPATLAVERTRWHQGRLLVTFAEVGDRTTAESLRNALLSVEVDPTESPSEPDEFYDHQLVGLEVLTTAGRRVGAVAEILHGPGQDLLSVRDGEGEEILVPFVQQIVPEVNLAAGRLLVDELPGLLSPAVEDEEGGA